MSILDCFRVGRGGMFGALFRPRASKILFAATKADHLHHAAHDRLEALAEMVAAAIAQAGFAGAEVDVIALAAVRATREGDGAARAANCRPSSALPTLGEWSAAGEKFDGQSEIALFPGDLPANVGALFEPGSHAFRGLTAGCGKDTDFRFVRFRPPQLEQAADGLPALPHIRLDRAMQFLFGDRLR